jgi:hypothetical protein
MTLEEVVVAKLQLVYPRIMSTDLDVLFCKMCFPSLAHGA